MSKFQPGDRVRCTGKWNYGAGATVLEPEEGAQSYEVLIKCDKKPRGTRRNITYTHDDQLELESIYNSPLYQALK